MRLRKGKMPTVRVQVEGGLWLELPKDLNKTQQKERVAKFLTKRLIPHRIYHSKTVLEAKNAQL